MEKENSEIIRVGSRKSELALIQTNHVIDCLKKVYPDKEFEIVSMTTLGDRILNISLPKIGEKALFTKDLEDALRNDSVDFVVHSLKDLPTVLPDGLAIGAVLEREDPRDALVLRNQYKGNTLATLPEGSLIGTSSLRRTAQINASYPHLRVSDVRGNLNTRLRKLDEPTEHYAALLLAKAGLQRMGWENRCDYVLPCSEMLYAVGQGAIAIECRSNNVPILKMLSPLNHSATYCRVLAERSCLKTLGGGCSAPVGISTTLKQDGDQYNLSILSAVWSLDGKQKVSSKSVAQFASLTRGVKHRLSPTDENDCKKVKIDADKDLAKSGNTSSDQNLTDQSKTDEVPIYCGMTENFNIPIDVIIKCESLGVDLANEMIQNGALEVMKLTQDMIRSSIGDTNTNDVVVA